MGEVVAKKAPWERAVAKFGAYFEEKGLSAQDIPAAIIVHEVIGLAMALGFWSACYALQPSRTLARLAAAGLSKMRHSAALQRAYSRAMASATATVSRMSWLQRAPGIDPGRLTVSLAESLCFRAFAKPATFVFKLWASYKVVMLLKFGQGGGNGAPQPVQLGGKRQ